MGGVRILDIEVLVWFVAGVCWHDYIIVPTVARLAGVCKSHFMANFQSCDHFDV